MARDTNPQVFKINIKEILETGSLYFNDNLLTLQSCTVNLACTYQDQNTYYNYHFLADKTASLKEDYHKGLLPRLAAAIGS